MSEIIGGLGTSHAPSIAAAHDGGKQADPPWRTVFDGFVPARDWLARSQPDTVILAYNDHLNRFRFDTYPTFALGLSPEHAIADEGRGPRPFPPVPGDPELAWHVAESVVAQNFDLTLCQEMTLDHGIMSVLPLLFPVPWPVRVIPLAVNAILYPLPTPQRCYDLGVAIARAVASHQGSSRVLMMASGGLSHQLHGPDFGFVNPEWDQRFLDLIESDPDVLARASHEDFASRGGAESVEMMLWLVMRGALAHTAPAWQRVHRSYAAPGITGCGVLALEAMNKRQPQ